MHPHSTHFVLQVKKCTPKYKFCHFKPVQIAVQCPCPTFKQKKSRKSGSICFLSCIYGCLIYSFVIYPKLARFFGFIAALGYWVVCSFDVESAVWAAFFVVM
jgi:hypothetical protein